MTRERPTLVHIHYLRPPDREQIFTQYLIHEEESVETSAETSAEASAEAGLEAGAEASAEAGLEAGVKVTYAQDLKVDPPMRIAGAVVLETGSEVIWFTFPGAWHDIGLFHRADGSLSGTYANILTPCVFEEGGVWRTTDLFLDIWIDPSGDLLVLDEDELEEAEAKGWVDPDTARRARDEITRLSAQAAAGLWPPAVVERWSLARARELAGVKAQSLLKPDRDQR